MAHGNSDAPATDFAITTVNVPDRLDLRDIDDRKQVEEDQRARRDPAVLRAWLSRIALVAVVAIVVTLLWQVYAGWRQSMSPARLAARLSADLGTPITVGDTGLALLPSPRLVLSQVNIGHTPLERVEARLSVRDFARFLQPEDFHWITVVVGPAKLRLDQGLDIAQLLPKLGTALGPGVSDLHFEDVVVPDQDWLAGHWRVDFERDTRGKFSSLHAQQANGTGFAELTLKPATRESLSFEFQADHWKLPFGPFTGTDFVSAEGSLSYAEVAVTHYSLGGTYGEVHGSLEATAEDAGWKLRGDAATDGLDVDTLLRQAAPRRAPQGSGEAEQTPFAQGTASFSGSFQGKGGSLEEAAEAARLAAPLQVRSAVLNGINLGYVATNPGASLEASGGSTRFSAFNALLVVSGGEVDVREIKGRAGALLALGDVSVRTNHELSGLLHVDLGATRVLAPIRVHVRGRLEEPRFGP